jgi:uncharacterized membrane protein YgcG
VSACLCNLRVCAARTHRTRWKKVGHKVRAVAPCVHSSLWLIKNVTLDGGPTPPAPAPHHSPAWQGTFLHFSSAPAKVLNCLTFVRRRLFRAFCSLWPYLEAKRSATKRALRFFAQMTHSINSLYTRVSERPRTPTAPRPFRPPAPRPRGPAAPRPHGLALSSCLPTATLSSDRPRLTYIRTYCSDIHEWIGKSGGGGGGGGCGCIGGGGGGGYGGSV